MQTSPVARRPPGRRTGAAAVLAGLLLGSVLPALPASAAERVVIEADGGQEPRELTSSPGDSAVLVDPDALPAPTSRAPAPEAGSPVAPPAPGDLPAPGSPRSLGLPAVLAAVLALGVASLLVRVLLAEPAARRPPPAAGPS